MASSYLAYGLCFSAIFLVLQHICRTSTLDVDTRHLHDVLATFIAKDQLVIEQFPPLSLILAVQLPGLDLLWILVGCQLLVVSTLIYSTPPKPIVLSKTLYHLCIPPIILGFAILLISPRDLSHPDPLATASSLSSYIHVLVVLNILSAQSGRLRKVDNFFGASEILVILGYCIGSNQVDSLTSYLLVLMDRITSTCNMHRAPLYSKYFLVPHLGLILLRTIILPPLLLAIIYGTLFPFSETAAGGNFNLSFLNPTNRRMISPYQRTATISDTSLHGPYPPYALVPSTPLSLYIPRAGFLWTDRQTWLESMGIFGTLEEKGGEKLTDILAERSYFADPIARRHPWVLELAYLEPGLNPMQEDYRVSRVPPEDAVYLRSRITERYLGTVEGNPSIVDRELGTIPDQNTGFYRYEVGSYAKPSFNTTWLIEYDQFSDTGLRLYNPVQSCYLGTSYRTYIDYDGDSGNDTVKREINKVVEATCTRASRKEASTLWVIEGNPGHVQKEVTALKRGWAILQALSDLSQWRSRYARTLELSYPFRNRSERKWSISFILECALVSTFIAFFTLLCLRRKRWPRDDENRGELKYRSLQVLSFPIWLHVFACGLMGIRRPYDGQFVVALSMLGIVKSCDYYLLR